MLQATEDYADLYESDETARLEAMAELIASGKNAKLDYVHLQEYLTDMANRDRREVVNRVRCFLMHLVKWGHEVEERSGGWAARIVRLQTDLEMLLESRVLRKHAETELARTYEDAVGLVAVELGERESQFPKKCPWSVEMLVAEDLLEKVGV